MIFVDTSFWAALSNPRDGLHSEAESLYSRYADHKLLTSNHVIGETWTLLRRRAGHPSAVDFVNQASHSPRLHIHRTSNLEELRSFDWLRSRNEREYSFVDATSFAVMTSLGIGSALAFDGDFSAAGFVELR